jgi:hypothetical protein
VFLSKSRAGPLLLRHPGNIAGVLLMMRSAIGLLPLTLAATFGVSSFAQNAVKDDVIPGSVKVWRAEGTPHTYNPETVFDYLDGGAEVYLAYGMKNVRALKYNHPGSPSIYLSIFEMEESDGAFGSFTYERLDAEAGIGQGSEYGAGMLRFWQGSHFVFIQAEQETPASREAVLALGKILASRLGGDGRLPALLDALPEERLRPLSVRYVISPLILKNLERTLDNNPLGLHQRTAAVMGRYGKPGNPERILLARFSDEGAASRGVDAYLKTRPGGVHKPTEPYSGPDGWSLAAASGIHAVLILDAPDVSTVRKHYEEIHLRLKEISR